MAGGVDAEGSVAIASNHVHVALRRKPSEGVPQLQRRGRPHNPSPAPVDSSAVIIRSLVGPRRYEESDWVSVLPPFIGRS
jgi:hypothetical protein